MSVHAKLAQARVELQSVNMNKSGHNKFAGYRYFELADFMPHINRIFAKIGLCGIVSFAPDIAKLTIYDTESDGQIVIESPMAEAQLKGSHPIQNLGAVETYQRRYLWVAAMEIVEHDALDGSNPADREPPKEVDTLDIELAMEAATSMDELLTIWNDIPKDLQKKLKGKASEMKTKLKGGNNGTAV
jgi:ERF superfamily